MHSRNTLVLVLHILFAAPFTIFGLVALAFGVRALFHEPLDVVAMGAGCVLGAVFVCIGVLVIRQGRKKVRLVNERAVALNENSDCLWMLREDWANGVIAGSNKPIRKVAWLFAIIWSLVSASVVLGFKTEFIENDNHLFLLAFLFPLLGLGLLTWAVRATRRYKKFGVSELALRAVPVRPGRWFHGVIRVCRRLDIVDGFRLELSCIRRRVTGSGKHRRVCESILWQESHTVERGLDDRAFEETNIPVSFHLPPDVQVATMENPNDRVYWSLKVSAKAPGVDYTSVFELPVFTASDDRVQSFDDPRWEGSDNEDWAAAYKRIEEPVFAEPLWRGGVTESQVRVEPHGLDGREFFFPAARNKSVAIGFTLFTGLWTGVVALILHFGAPLLFPIVFGLFNVLLVFGMLDLWFGTTRAVIDPRGVKVSRRYLGLGTTRDVPSEEIEGFELKIGMQNNRTLYYDIHIRLRDGKKQRVGPEIREKREAEWLLEAMRESFGRNVEAVTAGV